MDRSRHSRTTLVLDKNNAVAAFMCYWRAKRM
jgi:hypothetical protein